MTEEVATSESEIKAEEPSTEISLEPAPGAEEQKPTPTASEEPAETAEQQEEKKQSKFQRRLERQKTARIAAETEVRLLREQLAGLKQSAPAVAAEPQRDQFETPEEYHAAIAAHVAKQVTSDELKTEREARQAQETKARQSAGEEAIAKSWNEREAAFNVEAKDYKEVVAAFIEDGEVSALPEITRRAILESDVGPQLLYHLAKNTEDAERIAELSPARQVAEIGKLETKLSPVAKKVSNAPAPIKTVPQGRSAVQGYSDNMSNEEFRAWSKANGAKWARR